MITQPGFQTNAMGSLAGHALLAELIDNGSPLRHEDRCSRERGAALSCGGFVWRSPLYHHGYVVPCVKNHRNSSIVLGAALWNSCHQELRHFFEVSSGADKDESTCCKNSELLPIAMGVALQCLGLTLCDADLE